MNSITVKLLWIIAFMTLLLDISAGNPIKSSRSILSFHESKNSKKEEESYSVFAHPLMILSYILLIIWIAVQSIYERLHYVMLRKFLFIFWLFCYAPCECIFNIYQVLRHRQYRRASTSEDVVRGQRFAETRV